MNILILGMDNTGKTTLSKELLENLKNDFKLLNSKGPNQTKEEMENFIKNNLKKDENLIFDRFCFFEEMVYGKILRGKSKFNYKDKIFKFIIENDPIIVYCRPNKKIINNWQNREQMDGVIDNSNQLLKQYDKVIKKAKKYNLRVIKYDYTKENVFNVISKL